MSSSTDIALINAICILEDNENKLNLITKLKSCQLQLSTERKDESINNVICILDEVSKCLHHSHMLLYSLTRSCCDGLSFVF